MDAMPRRQLGSSGIDVSVLSLGSWMTFEHMSIDQGVAVMRAARDAGIDFLDDARYDDRTGTAPIPTGYSEVRFGELFRAGRVETRRRRGREQAVARVLAATRRVAAELDASLQRMGFDYLDLEYCAPPPDGHASSPSWWRRSAISSRRASCARGACSTGPSTSCATRCASRADRASRRRVPRSSRTTSCSPRWSRIRRSSRCSTTSGVGVVASAVLAGGALTGKYAEPAAAGRIAANLDSPQLRKRARGR